MKGKFRTAYLCGLIATFGPLSVYSQGMSDSPPGGGMGFPGAGMGFPGAGQAPDIALSEVADNLFLVSKGRLGNSAVLVGEEGAFLVDSAFNAPLAEAVQATINDVFDGDVRYLVNTHAHGDHTGGNAVFGERGAVIVGHESVRATLTAGSQRAGPSPPEALPVITYGNGQGVTIHLNGETIRVMHMTPAHTVDNSIVHFVNANVFVVGDIFSPARYPVFDGTTSQGTLDALDILLSLADDRSRFVPGWGEASGRADVVAYRQMIATVRETIAALVAEDKPLEEVIASNPTAPFDRTWGSPGNPRFLPVIYEEMKASRQ